jgi:hypothetical protein
MNADELRRTTEQAKRQAAKQKAEEEARAKQTAVQQYDENMWRHAKWCVEYHLEDSAKLEAQARLGRTHEVIFTDETGKNPRFFNSGARTLDTLYKYKWIHGHLFGRTDPYREYCNEKCHHEVTRMPDYMKYVYDAIVSRGFRVRWMIHGGDVTIVAEWG